MSDLEHSVTVVPECEATLSWDLIPDEHAPSSAIIMRFATYEAAHSILTVAGFAPIGGPVPVRREDVWTSVRYAHPDGSTVVLAHQPAEWRGAAEPCEERLGLAAVGG